MNLPFTSSPHVSRASLVRWQGRVRTKTVKRSARVIVEQYYGKLSTDFHTNKRVCDEVAVVPSKRMRNKIAGFVTHLLRRIERGESVRGVSLKLQEEERERRMDFVPEQSEINTSNIVVDKDTAEMLRELNFDFDVSVQDPQPARFRTGRRRD